MRNSTKKSNDVMVHFETSQDNVPEILEIVNIFHDEVILCLQKKMTDNSKFENHI